MPLNRLVALLTPAAALLAGLGADWLAKHFPGVEIPASALEEVFVAGMVAVVAPALLWLHGWQRHEARESGVAALDEENRQDGNFIARLASHAR